MKIRKARRIVFTIEIESTEAIRDLKNVIRENLEFQDMDGERITKIIQIQSNVIKPEDA